MTSAPPALRRLPASGRFDDILQRMAEAPDAPYRGISSYRLLDAGLLFARDEQIERLTHLIVVYRGALVFGESGVGKTSMLNAGFVPEALRRGYLPERVRVRWHSTAPIVIEHIGLETSAQGATLPSNFGTDTIQTGHSLALGVDDFERRLTALRPEQGAMLVFDQFEELVTLFEDAPGSDELQGALAMQQRIFDLLIQGLTAPGIAAKFVFSMREDYLGRMSPLVGRVSDLRERFVHVDPLKGPDLPQIVRGPIEKYPDSYAARMPAATLEEIIDRFQKQVGAGSVNLSEVQIVCRRLWDEPGETIRLRKEGIGAVIDSYFSDQFARSTPEEQAAIKALMSCLVTPGGTRNWVSADDLLGRAAAETGAPRPRLEQLIRDLDREGRRLVTSEERQNVVYYTILSEFLVPRIRTWQEERRLAEEQAKHREEQRKVKARIQLGILVAALTLAALFGMEQRQHAIAKEQEAAAKAESLAVMLLSSDSLNAQALSANRRADSIATDLARVSDSLSRTASQGTAKERALAEQLQKTQTELRRVLALTDTARQSSASGSEALARENQLLRSQLASTADIADQMRRLHDQLRYGDPKAAAYLNELANKLDGLSPRVMKK
jgi:hypothetical protein